MGYVMGRSQVNLGLYEAAICGLSSSNVPLHDPWFLPRALNLESLVNREQRRGSYASNLGCLRIHRAMGRSEGCSLFRLTREDIIYRAVLPWMEDDASICFGQCVRAEAISIPRADWPVLLLPSGRARRVAESGR